MCRRVKGMENAQRIRGAVCKKNIQNKFVTFFPYLEIIKIARKFIYK